MTDFGAIIIGLGVFVGQISTAYVLVSKSNRDARESREDRARNAQSLQAHLEKQDTTLVALHASTNGLSKRAEDLAKEVGKLQGRADEKANPTP
jgi:hypothetical protein